MKSFAGVKGGDDWTGRWRIHVALGLLTKNQRIRFLLLTLARTAVGIFDLALAAAIYLVFLLLQAQAPAHHREWMPRTILAAALLSAALVVLRAFIDVLSARAVLGQIQDLAVDFMLRLTRGYCETRWDRFVELNRSELTNTAIHTTREASDFYHRCIEMIAALVTVFLMTGALIYENRIAAIVFACTLGAFYLMHQLIIRKRVQRSAAVREESLCKLQREFSSLFFSGKEVRAYGNQSFFYDRIRSHAERFAAGSRRAVFLPQAARIVADQGTVLLFLAIIVAVQLLQGDTRQLLAVLAFYFVLSRRLLPLVSQLSLIAGQMESSFESVLIVDAELNRCRKHRSIPAPALKPAPAIALQLEQVSFAFDGGALILNHINLLLREGEIAVLRGASGVGKTSLLNIISGVLQPTAGSVHVDRAQIAHVPQEVSLLDDTIRNNLLFGLPEADDRKLMEGLAAARLDDFVAALPRGLDTAVGDNGALLSGGERQRFGVARAVVRSRKLLLLDEATSALDEENERHVLGNLAATGVTILLVTHRRYAQWWADHVYRLENGQLVEERDSVAPAIDDVTPTMLDHASSGMER
jgi:ABC-type multidrug transport system fused ATPase/permease subunit